MTELALPPTPTVELTSYVYKRENKQEEQSVKSLEDVTKRYYDDIHQLVHRFISNKSSLARLEEVADEIIQETLLRFYSGLKRGPIEYPQAYIRSIIQTVYRNWLREERRRESQVLILSNKDAEEREIQGSINEVIEQASRQQYAIFCSPKEHLDEISLLAEALLKYHVNVEDGNWPQALQEREQLSSLLAVTRKKLQRKAKLRSKFASSIGQIERLLELHSSIYEAVSYHNFISRKLSAKKSGGNGIYIHLVSAQIITIYSG